MVNLIIAFKGEYKQINIGKYRSVKFLIYTSLPEEVHITKFIIHLLIYELIQTK